MRNRVAWWFGLLACTLLWAWTGIMVLIVLGYYPMSDIHYTNPGEVFRAFLDPVSLVWLGLPLVGAVGMTVLLFRCKRHR
jgi:hypothetical protein